MARTPAQATMTAEDRLRRDYDLMTRLAILHKPQTTSDNWPSNVSNTFRNIDKLGSLRFQFYEEMTPPPHSHNAWRLGIKSRAKELSDMAQRLLSENPSELTWRLELEKLVDARFRMKTECGDCEGRTWRSEIEVTAECYGPVSENLGRRRLQRTVCQCPASTYSGLNSIVSNRADQCFQYDPHLSEVPEHDRLPKRRPDRLYGLKETKIFQEKLEKSAQCRDDSIQQSVTAALDDIDSESDRILVRDLIQLSPFNRRGPPLLFPFLILEAKSETGQGFANSAIQTSLPIWALLKGQENMIKHSAALDEQGGPFLWYIAYLGDAWRVSGCCISTERRRPTYQIIDLWNGRISSPDGAMQLLLIVDYIFDWARDLYRPLILRALGAMSGSEFESASIAEDSDIFSSRANPRIDDVSDQESISGFAEPALSVDNAKLSFWTKFDLVDNWRKFSYRSFRPANIIKSEFHCLYINGDNMGTLSAALGRNPSLIMKTARDVLSALRMGPMVATENILSHIEDFWTGTPRTSRYGGTARKIICSIACATSVSDSWKLQSTITCVAVDMHALNTIRRDAGLKRKTFRLDNVEEIAQTLSEENAGDILQQMRLRNGRDHISCILTKLIEVWTPTKLLSKKQGSQLAGASTAEVVLQPRWGELYRAYKVVLDTYNRHKQPGLLEPDYPYIRFSTRISCLESEEFADDRQLLRTERPPWVHGIFSREPILVCDSNEERTHLCLYILDEIDHPPQRRELASALFTAISAQNFFVLNQDARSRSAANSEPGNLPRINPGGRLMPIVKNSAKAWLRDLLKSVDTTNEAYEPLEISDDDEEDISRYSSMPFSDPRQYKHRRRSESPRRTNGGQTEARGWAFPSETPSSSTDEDLLLYSNSMEINTILEQADGDKLTDDQMSVLIQLGYFQ